MTKPKNKTEEEKKKIYPLQMRVEKGLSEKLKIIAERESRSLNGQIEYILKKFIENDEAKK